MRKRHGFTLIELLVVVAIVVALLAILAPSMHRAYAMSESVVCAGRLRQLHLGTLTYASDNFSILPGAREWVDNSIAGFNSWKAPQAVKNGLLYEYVAGLDEAYLCPTFLGVYRSNPSNASATPAFSYAMNIYFIRPGQVTAEGWAGYPSIQTMAHVVAPGLLALYAEQNPWAMPSYNNGIDDGLFAATGSPSSPNPPYFDAIATYHLGKDHNSGMGNAVFVDGHVERRPIEDTYEIGTPQNYR